MGIFLLVASAFIFLLNRGFSRFFSLVRRYPFSTVGSLLLLLALVFAAVYPLYITHTQHQQVRGIEENRQYSAEAQNLFRVFDDNWLHSKLRVLKTTKAKEASWEKRLYPGFLPVASLFAALVMLCWKFVCSFNSGDESRQSPTLHAFQG